MKKPQYSLAALALTALLLSSCAAGTAAQQPLSEAASPSSSASAEGGHAAHGSSTSSSDPAGGPSEASLMVCGDETMGNVTSILGLDSEPHTVNSWANSTFACTYHMLGGALKITVQEAADKSTALKYFDAMEALSTDAKPIEGLSNLGFPAYETADGSTVFQKDSMILHVDASGLPEKLGPNSITRTEFAYQLSTTILACWIEHP